MSRYSDERLDQLEIAMEAIEQRERERIADYLLPKLRKLDIAALRILGRRFQIYGYREMCKIELVEELSYCHGDDICWNILKVKV